MKNLGRKLAIGALSLFLAGKSISAYTPQDISEIKTAFEFENGIYFVLQNGNIASGKDDVIITDKNGKWTREGKIMPVKFGQEVEKVLKISGGKSKSGITLVDYFEYTNAEKQKNCFNLWSDGSVTFGPYSIGSESRWFYDANGNGKKDRNEHYMSQSFDSIANSKVKGIILQINSLRKNVKDFEKEESEYKNRINNLNATIIQYSNNSDPTKTAQYLKLISDLQSTKEEYNSKISELEKELADSKSKIGQLERTISEVNVPQNAKREETATPVNDKTQQEKRGKGSDEDMSVLINNFTIPQPKVYPDYRGAVISVNAGLVLDNNNSPVGYDGEFGIRYDFGRVGIGAEIGAGAGSSELIDSYLGDDSPITGRHDEGKITMQEIIRLKAGLEARLELSKPTSKLAFGLLIEGGAVYIPTNEKVEEKIFSKTGEVLAQNSYSISGNQIDYYGGVGLDMGNKKGIRFNIIIGGESNKGAYAKLGMEIPVSKN